MLNTVRNPHVDHPPPCEGYVGADRTGPGLLADYDDLTEQVSSAEGEGPDSTSLPPLPSRAAVINHAGALRSARAPERHQKVVGGVLEHDLRHGGTLASRLTVQPHASLDADMSVIGTPGGVLEVRTLQVLHPAEAGHRFISRNTLPVPHTHKTSPANCDRLC